MRILLTNDDGIDAPGLAALRGAIPSEVETFVVAPDCQRSECGHSVTTRTEIELVERGEGWWAATGTPVDCVRVALSVLGGRIDGVISGVNDGGNLGADIYMSGTVAAAREAALHGIPAVAVSHYRRPELGRTWGHVPAWLEGLLVPLLTEHFRGGSFWNVNLPADPARPAPERVVAELDREPMPIGYQTIQLSSPKPSGKEPSLGNSRRFRYAADYHGRPQRPGTDVTACFTGNIALTRIHLGW